MYQSVFDLIVDCGAVSLPIVVVCGIVGKLFNALVSMVIGKERVNI